MNTDTLKRTRIKICCMSSVDEIRIAVRAGADALGFVGEMPSGAGIIGEEVASQLIPIVPPPVATFLLTCETDATRIVSQQRRCGANTLQLVDRVSEEVRSLVCRQLPGIKIVQVVHVTGRESVDEALSAQETADAILLDSGNQSGAIKELGGTGRVHDWAISAEIREKLRVPIFLAGGLNPGNVREAIDAVRPYGVDVCSGLRTEGKLDPAKVDAFISAVNQ
ncbi:MAG: phosphoribosylanthranilate isomerase [Gemmatimonadaceae bacterium]|nr:phosphoribosylanthranilate isomerase [Gemmatimonadaceae bacterium]